MNNKNRKSLSKLPIEVWPIIGALSFAKDFNTKQFESLLNADSFNQQISHYSSGIELSEFRALANELDISTLKDVEQVFEGSLELDVKKAQGVVYTPDFVIDFILDQTITSNNLPSENNPVLDPACGSGGFLVRAAVKISKLTGNSLSDCTRYLCGLDINEKAISNAKMLLDLACLHYSGELSQAKLMVADSLLESIDSQFSKLKIAGGVSSLVTNPPYVKLQNLDKNYSSKLTEIYPDVASGAFSLASLFLYNSPKYLAPKGKAGFITLNNVFTSLSGKNLRRIWSSERHIRRIIDFRHFTVFDASAYTCLIFLDKKNLDSFEYNAVAEAPSYQYLTNLVPTSINYDDLEDSKWRLGDAGALRLVSAMESVGQPLKSVAEIKVGFATLRDKVFMGRYDEGIATFIGGDGVARVVEEDAVSSFYKVSEFKEDESIQEFIRPIIYPYDKTKRTRPLISISEFSERFPIAFEHLKSWKNELMSRGYTEEESWHEWGRRQSLVADGPKLLTKTFDLSPTFRLDSSNALFCNGYSVKPKDIFEPYSIEQLKYFLESRFVHAYALITSFEIAGGYQCYQKNFIEKISLPPRQFINPDSFERSTFEENVCRFYGISVFELDNVLTHYSS